MRADCSTLPASGGPIRRRSRLGCRGWLRRRRRIGVARRHAALGLLARPGTRGRGAYGEHLAVVRLGAVDDSGGCGATAEADEASPDRGVELRKRRDRLNTAASGEVQAGLVGPRNSEQREGEDASSDDFFDAEDVDVGAGDAVRLLGGHAVHPLEVEGHVVDPPLAIRGTRRGRRGELGDDSGARSSRPWP